MAQLKEWGIHNIYGVAGDAILPFLGAIEKQKEIRYIGVRHESAAGMMASAEGKCTQHIGVCLCTSGPGLLNLLNGIADASMDHVPLLVISGQVESKKIGTNAKQYVEQQQMIAPLAVYSASLIHPEAAVDVLQKALIEAQSKRGVAHISVPKDIFSRPCTQTVQKMVGVLHRAQMKDVTQLDVSVMHLLEAKKPMILIGEGARKAAHEVVLLAEALGAGNIESLGAKGCVPHDHPLYLNGIGEGGTIEGREAFIQTDVVLAVGVNWWPEGYVPQQAKIIQIDISPATIEGHKDVVCGLIGDAQEVVSMLLTKVREHNNNGQHERYEWKQLIAGYKQTIGIQLATEREQKTNPLAPQRVIAAVDETVNDDAIMVIDTGDHTIWFNRVFQAKKQQQVLYSGKWRTMGFALPAAISAKLNHPSKQVVAIVGDGCFTMTMMELLTAVQYKIAVVILIMNNQSLAMEKHKMITEHIEPFGTELHNPNFALMAEAFGAIGLKVTTENELIPALQKASAAQQPIVIDVHVADIMPPLTGFKPSS